MAWTHKLQGGHKLPGQQASRDCDH